MRMGARLLALAAGLGLAGPPAGGCAATPRAAPAEATFDVADDGPRAVEIQLGDRRGWRAAVLDEVRRIYARRLDVDALPWWTRVTVWLDEGRVVAAEVPRSALDERPIFAAALDVGGARVFYDAEGRALDGPFLARPVDDRRHARASVTSRRGMRLHPILGRWRFHEGTDYAAEPGTPVVALGSGTVTRVRRDRARGLYVVVRHDNGMETRYMHLQRVSRRILKKKRVGRGDVLGFVGESGLATGPHLHFELRWKKPGPRGRWRSLDPVGMEWPAGAPLPPEHAAAHEALVEALRAKKPRAVVDASPLSSSPRG